MSSAVSLISASSLSRSSPVSLDKRHVEDFLRLKADRSKFSIRPALADSGVLRRADEVDDRVDVVDRNLQAPSEDVHARLGLLQVELGAPGDHVAPVLDELLQRLLERQGLRPSVDDGQAVDAKRFLQRRHLHRLFITTSGTASFFRSTTTRMPSRSDSSRTSEMPSILFSRTNSAIFSMSLALLTW